MANHTLPPPQPSPPSRRRGGDFSDSEGSGDDEVALAGLLGSYDEASVCGTASDPEWERVELAEADQIAALARVRSIGH